MKTKALLASLLFSGAAFAQTAPFVMVTPSDYNIMSASPNGKWACGMYYDASNEAYGFRWNLESGEIDLLNPSSPSQAYGVSNDGIVVGVYTDNSFKKNGASIQLAGYWSNNRWNRLEMPSDAVNSSGAAGISPDGHYITGNVAVGSNYSGYVWKDGKIFRQLKENKKIAMPYAISPDGQYVTGWVMNKNRQACFWGPDGNFTTLSDQQSPFCVGKKFSPNGKKLLYFGGWQTDEEAGGADKIHGAWAIYDMKTGNKSAILPAGTKDDLDFFDISDKGTVMCEDNNLGYIYQNGKGTFAYKYLKEKGVNLADYHVFVNPDAPKDSDGETLYNVTRATSVSCDDHIMGFIYYNDNKDEDGNYAISSQSMIVKFGNPLFSAMPPVSVKAQQMSGLNTVKITWKPNVAATGITGYKVYRDGNKVSSDVVTAEGFVDAGVPVGEHKYQITAMYGDVESADSETATVTVQAQKVSKPTGFFAQQHGYNSVFLEWNNPATNFGQLTYFAPDDAQLETFGLSYANLSYETAIAFDAVTLSAYKGQKLTSVGFYPMEAQGGWTINLYTRDAAGKLQKFYTQPVTQQLNYGERNVVTLTTPQDVPANELLVSVEVAVTTASKRISALDNVHAVRGKSDLLRVTTDDDFESIGDIMEAENVLYAASWAIDATVAPAGADLTKDNVASYNIYVDNKKVGSSDAKTFTVASVEKGTHALGVSAVYANSVESEQTIVQLDVTPDDSQLQAVSGVKVAPVSASAVKATWQQPLDRDVVKVQYCSGSASGQIVTAPADNNYGLMVGAVYPSKTFRGRTGYVMKKARFYPLADATYTVYVYKDDKIINETAVENYTLGKWNEVELSAPIVVENGASYRLAVDCYDVEPGKPAIALDNNAPMEGYSDIYTLDGESWSSITSTGVSANWMIGLVLETAQPKVLPIDGYDVYIDNAKKNTEKVAETTFTHDFGTDDKQQHTIRVDVYYTVKSKSVKGGVTKFLIAVAGINENTVGRIEMRQGENELTVTGENVESVELVSAAGAVVAKAKGDTVSLNGVPAGMYVVKAVVAGETVTRKVMLTK